jgi:hypothetical protein
MKHLRFALALLVSFMVQGAVGQSLDEIIDKHIQALGGKALISELRSVRMECNLSVQGMDIPVVMTRVHNVGQRVDISAMGMDGYLISTPTEGWTYMPFMGQTAAEPMPEDQVKEGADELDIQGLLFNYKDKGHSVELLGNEDVDGTACHKLKVVTKNGKERTYFLDTKNYYIIRTVAKAFVMGQEMEVTQNMGDYKKTEDGYVMAHSISGAFGQGDLTVTKYVINKPVDDKLFKAAQ